MSERRFFDDASEGHSDIQTNLHGTRKAKFYGTVERNQYKQNKENVNRINRITAVREQEKQKAKKNTKEGREQERLDQEREFEEEKLRKYIAIQEEMRKIEEAKRLVEIEAGQAHRNAEISVKLREDRERHRLEETQRNNLAAADRGNRAAATQRDLEEQMNGPRRKYLENRDKVLEQEEDRARKLAAEYREKERDRSEEREDYTSYGDFNKNKSRGVFNHRVGDFSKSHLHNSIVVSHDGEGQISAFENARREEERTTVRREEFRASKDDVRMKSLERWQSATQKEKEKKKEKAFEDQMQRLQKAKNLQKIEEGKKYPEAQLKPATKLQIQNRNQKLAEKEFEDMFMGKSGKGAEATKGKKTTTRPPFKAPTQPPARPHPLVEQSTLSGGFDNTTNRTNEFQEQDHEESEEEQPRSTTVKESSYRQEDSREKRQPDSPQKYPDHEEDEEEEEEEPRDSELASSKKYHNESSYSRYDQTPEESTMRQDDAAKRQGLMSFGDRQRQQANAVGKSPELSSYQQEGTAQYERDNYLGQSQSSGLSDSRYQRREEEQQEKTKQRRAVDNDINNYINEQEVFLQNLENHRKKLNDKLRTTTQENLPNEQPKRAAQPERQAANVTKSSLNSTSKSVAVQEDEAIEDLQKRAESLLSRFMQPAKEEEEHSEEEEEEEEDSLEYSPAKYGAGLGDTKTTQNNYNEQTQSYAYSQDELEEEKEYSPEKSHQNRYRANARDDSPSELDYSMSDRGERSEKKSKGPAKVDYAVSFGTKQFVPPTETFGKKQNPFEDSSRGGKQAAPVPVKEDKKAWKMDFDMADDQKAPPQTRNKPQQRERPSANSHKQGELVEDEAQGPSLAELFQKNRKKMIEKYEQHQKEHPEKPEVKEAKPVRTKEEILKQRKAMMEYKAPLSVKAKEQNQAEREARKEEMNDPFKKSRKSKSKEPKPELLDRLAFGKKATVDKKEMLKLTNKNYELLPEVKKKKEEEKKKEEQRLRRENAKKLDKEIRSKLMK